LSVKISFPANLILSKLDKDDVAKRTLLAIKRGEEFVVVPWVMRVAPLLLVLPVWLRNLAYDLIGESKYMDTFQGRGDKWYRKGQKRN